MKFHFLSCSISALVFAACLQAQSSPSPTTTGNAPDSTKLEVVRTGRVSYPPAALAGRIQGRVTVRLSVDENGKVVSQTLVGGHPMLSDEALRAAHDYEFKPLIRGGKAIPFVTELVFDFRGPNGIYTEKTNVVQIQGAAVSGTADSTTPASSALRAAGPSETDSSKPVIKDSTHVVPIHKEKANYPILAGRELKQGQVLVKVAIDEQGDVISTEAVQGEPEFRDAAIAAAKKWKFEPFIRKGKPVKIATTIPFDFVIEGHIKDIKEAPPVSLAAGVSQGMLIHKVAPTYPPSARLSRVSGAVVLQAIIGKNGTIKNLRVISGPKELAQAAMGAVQQWRYRPYVINGEPVEVDTQIRVNFTLSEYP